MNKPILQVRDLARSFGALRAVDGVTLSVGPGTLTGLIGPNGAGKTTLFGLIAGALKPDAGEILFQDHRIDNLSPDRIFRAGLARTFQIPRPFPRMTVIDNVMLAALNQTGELFWNNWFAVGKVRMQERLIRERAMEVLGFTGLRAGPPTPREGTHMESHVGVVAGRELAHRVGVPLAGPPVLAGVVPGDEDQVSPVAAADLERAVAEDARMGGKLPDELVVPHVERGGVHVAPLHREEADPGDIPAVPEPRAVADDGPVFPAIRLARLQHERARTRGPVGQVADGRQHDSHRGQIVGRPGGIREPASLGRLVRLKTHARVHRGLRSRSFPPRTGRVNAPRPRS